MEGATSAMATALNNVDMSGITDEIKAVVPVVLPVLVSVLALRKGISFLIGVLRSA